MSEERLEFIASVSKWQNMREMKTEKSESVCGINLNLIVSIPLCTYEGYSKINLRLVGKNKRVVIASKRTLSSNKERRRTKRGRALSFCVKKTNHSTYLTAGGSGDDSVHVLSVFTLTLRGENV